MWKINSLTGNILEFLAVVASIGVAVTTLFHVMARFLGFSFMGALEIVMLFAIWMYMLGSLVASKNKKHLEVDLLALTIKNPKAKVLHSLYVSFLMILISVFFVYLAYKMMAWGVRLPRTTPGLSIPVIFSQSAIFLASLGTLAYSIRDFISSCKSLMYHGAYNSKLGR